MKPIQLAACMVFFSGFAVHGFAVELPAELLGGLASENFQDREKSEDSLLAWSRQRPKESMPALYAQSRSHESPEVRSRCLDVLKELVTDEYLREGESGYIGIMMAEQRVAVPGDPEQRMAILITDVVPGTPAEKFGLAVGDLIVGVDDHVWREFGAALAFGEEIKKYRPATKVSLKLLRKGEVVEVPLVLGRRPADMVGRFMGLTAEEIAESDRIAKERYFRQWVERQKGEE